MVVLENNHQNEGHEEVEDNEIQATHNDEVSIDIHQDPMKDEDLTHSALQNSSTIEKIKLSAVPDKIPMQIHKEIKKNNLIKPTENTLYTF